MNIASLVEYAILKPDSKIEEINKGCSAAVEKNYLSVCVLPLFIRKVKENLKGSRLKTAGITGFPFGHSAIEAKLAEAVLAIVDGADEIELQINTSAVKNADWQYLAKEINTLLPVIRAKNRIVTVILDTDLLDEREIITCCDIYGAAGVDFVKTTSGFGTKTITPETVRLLRKHLADAVKIIATVPGDHELAQKLVAAGADRICTPECFEMVNRIPA